MNGRSQAVRLPKEFRFEGDEVVVKKFGAGVVLLPKTVAYEQIIAIAGRFKGKIRRRQPSSQERNWS